MKERVIRPTDFIGPETRLHEQKHPEVNVRVVITELLLPLFEVRMVFEQPDHHLPDLGSELAECDGYRKHVTCRIPSQYVHVDQEKQGNQR
jgi:hypothetical protein